MFRTISVLAMVAMLSLLTACSDTKSSSNSRDRNEGRSDSSASKNRNSTTNNSKMDKHPSKDSDGFVFYFGNAQGRRSRKTVTTKMLLYTDGYAKKAKTFSRQHQISMLRLVNDDMMGAILDTMNKMAFFTWPASRDYSAMQDFPYASIGQISVTTDFRNHTSAWTSDDTQKMTPRSRSRYENFAKLRKIIFTFCNTSDFEISTKVEGH